MVDAIVDASSPRGRIDIRTGVGRRRRPEQLLLALEDIEQAIAGAEAADDKKDAVAARARGEKRRTNRGALPAHLPRLDVTIEPEDMNCPCCREPMHVIGEETSQRLDVIPAQFRVIVTHRPVVGDEPLSPEEFARLYCDPPRLIEN
jgi:zinc-finger binding domain of transposase IS66/Transposase C of IS166 homeodomain